MKLKRPVNLKVWLILIGYFTCLAVGAYRTSQTFYFQDETEHVVVGWVSRVFDRKLYKQVTSSHQLVPILFGKAISNFVGSESLYRNIIQIRAVMFLYFLVWAVGLVWRFRKKGLVASVFLSSVYYYYFGWHLLGDSLVAPAIVFQLLLLSEIWLKGKKSMVGSWDGVWFGVANLIVIFSLVWLWPYVLLVNLLWLMGKGLNREWKASMKAMAVGLVGLFILVSPIAWFKESVYLPVKYLSPTLKQPGFWDWVSYPVVSMVEFYQSVTSAALGIGLILTLIWIVSLENKKMVYGLVIYGLLLLTNMRVSATGAVFYEGFHLLPMVAVVAAGLANSVFEIRNKRIAGIMSLATILLVVNQSRWMFEKRNLVEDHHVEYGQFQRVGKALAEAGETGDSLMTGPDGFGYINMMAGLPFADGQNFHLNWSYEVKELKNRFVNAMEGEPPSYIYFQKETENGFYQLLSERYFDDYVRIKNEQDRETDLYVLSSRYKKMNDEQKSELLKI